MIFDVVDFVHVSHTRHYVQIVKYHTRNNHCDLVINTRITHYIRLWNGEKITCGHVATENNVIRLSTRWVYWHRPPLKSRRGTKCDLLAIKIFYRYCSIPRDQFFSLEIRTNTFYHMFFFFGLFLLFRCNSDKIWFIHKISCVFEFFPLFVFSIIKHQQLKVFSTFFSTNIIWFEYTFFF